MPKNVCFRRICLFEMRQYKNIPDKMLKYFNLGVEF